MKATREQRITKIEQAQQRRGGLAKVVRLKTRLPQFACLAAAEAVRREKAKRS